MGRSELPSLDDPKVRWEVARRDLAYFAALYLPHHLKYPLAPFQYELLDLLADKKVEQLVVTAFRGSGKSTLAGLALPLWAALGEQERRFIVLAARTQTQARLMMRNIRYELEHNYALKADFQIRVDESDEWRQDSLIIEPYGTRILALSYGASIRGIKHRDRRPDLVIIDDIEDIESVKTLESRDKLYEWLTSDVLPVGDLGTKYVIVGNLLHRDSVMMRLKKQSHKPKSSLCYREYPLVGANGRSLWPVKYPADAIQKMKRQVRSHNAWQREYLLRIVRDEGQIVTEDQLRFYDELPQDLMGGDIVGVDLAISSNQTADYTAMVPVSVRGSGETLEIYVLTPIVNAKLSGSEIFEYVAQLNTLLQGPTFYVESNGFQQIVVEELQRRNIPVEAIVSTHDKRARLMSVAHLFKNGRIYFPRKESKKFTTQLLGFGSERHDDLVDALVFAVSQALKMDKERADNWSYPIIMGVTRREY